MVVAAVEVVVAVVVELEVGEGLPKDKNCVLCCQRHSLQKLMKQHKI